MRNLSIKLSIPAIMLLGSSYLYGVTIKEAVENTMSSNPKIMSTIKSNEAFKYYIDEAKGGYYPKLDLTTYLQTKKTKTNPDIGNNTSATTSGPNVQLDFEQLLFDGGLTSGEVEEAGFREKSNKYANDAIVDTILFDTISAYLNMVRYKNSLIVTEDNLLTYEDYLATAKDTENISGEVLQKAQVNAKIHFTNSKLYEQTNNYKVAVSSFERFAGMEVEGAVCRPNIDETLIPTNLKDLIDQVVVKNSLVLEQVANIKEQRAKLNQEDSAFYPTIKFKAQGLYDKDNLTDDEQAEIYSARIELKYNLYNGNIDKSQQQRERIFLEQAQKELDVITKQVIDEATTAYNSFVYAKKRIAELKLYILDNKKVLSIFKDQFEGGTRTFIDVLNIERDLYNARIDLIAAELDYDLAYFNIFNKLSNLKESVIYANNQICVERVIQRASKEMPVKDNSDEEMKELLEEKPMSTDVSKTEEMVNKDYNYTLYLASFKNEMTAQAQLEKANELVADSYKTKIFKSNGFNTVVIYDVFDKDSILKAKESLNSAFPGSYFRKSMVK